MAKMYGSYSDEDLNEWERMPQNIRVLTSSAFGAWLLRRDKRIKEREPKTDWIPVTEKLPEEGEEVLVWYEYFRYGGYNCMWQTYGLGWQYDEHFNVVNGGEKQRVIAWRQLPKEYKESEGMT